MAKWRNDFVPKNKYTRPGRMLKGVKKIVLHWTANPGATALNHLKYFGVTLIALNKKKEAEGKKATYASAHIFVDQENAICIVPLNEVAFHANDGSYKGVAELIPNANELSIGVEMCVEEDGSISPKTLQRTVEVIAELCKLYKLTEKDIVRHFDVTKKLCPRPFIENPTKFSDLKKQVETLLKPKEETVYTVKSGDNLTKIATRYNKTVQQIAELNNINDKSLIFPGQKLKIK